MNEKKMLVQLTEDELMALIERSVTKAVMKKDEPDAKEDSLLTRSDVARLFKVSYVTINSWTRKGLLKSHHMNSRVYFLKSEVMQIFKTKNLK